MLTKKGIFFTVGTMSMLAVSGVVVSAIDNMKAEELLEKEKLERDNDRIIQEQAKKSELIKRYTGIHKNYVDYAYDANIIGSKISKRDYINDEKVVFLTFEDGISSTITPIVTDVLNYHNIKATFFIPGEILKNRYDSTSEIVKNIYNSGHSIGNRSYCSYGRVLFPGGKLNLDKFLNDYEKTDNLLKEILGEEFKTRVYRVPGGSTAWRGMNSLTTYAKENDLAIVDMNVTAQGKNKTVQEMIDKTVIDSQNKDLIVMSIPNNIGEEKMPEYLKGIIKWYKENGYVFRTLG